jgi:hypothetical protein
MKTATYHNAGRLSGDTADLFMFTCWNESRTTCGCHSVYAHELAKNIEALTRLGYTVVNNDARKSAA